MSKARTHFEQIPLEQVEKLAVNGTTNNGKGRREKGVSVEEQGKKSGPHSVRTVAQNAKKDRR